MVLEINTNFIASRFGREDKLRNKTFCVETCLHPNRGFRRNPFNVILLLRVTGVSFPETQI